MSFYTMTNAKKRNRIINNAVCLLIFIPTIAFYLSEMMVKVWGLPSPAPFLYVVLYLIAGLFLISLLVKKTQLFFVYIVLVSFAIFNILLFNNYRFAFTELYDLPNNSLLRMVFLGLPFLFVPIFIKSLLSFFKTLYRYSILVTILGVLSILFFVLNEQSFDYMSSSYNILFSSVFLFYYSFKNKKIVFLIVSIISFVIISITGSRGALVCLLSFLFLFFFFIQNKNKKQSTKKMITLFVFLCLVGLFFLNLDSIFSFLQNVTGSHSFYVRTIEKIKDGTFFVDRNRSLIYSSVFNSIIDSPLIGNGLFGDRRIVAISVPEYPTGTYAHNFFLEFLCDFGLFFGLIAILIGFFYLASFLKSNKTKNQYDLVLIAFSCEFVKLLFTGSYLTSSLFFFVVGYMFFNPKTEKSIVASNQISFSNGVTLLSK